MLNFQAIIIKIPESIKWYNTKNRNISFEYPQKSLLKSSYPKKIIAKIKKSSLSLEIWSTPPPPPHRGQKCPDSAVDGVGPKVPRRRRQRERQKKFRLPKQQLNLHMQQFFFGTFLSGRDTTTTWKCQISRFIAYVIKVRRRFLSLSELRYDS